MWPLCLITWESLDYLAWHISPVTIWQQLTFTTPTLCPSLLYMLLFLKHGMPFQAPTCLYAPTPGISYTLSSTSDLKVISSMKFALFCLRPSLIQGQSSLAFSFPLCYILEARKGKGSLVKLVLWPAWKVPFSTLTKTVTSRGIVRNNFTWGCVLVMRNFPSVVLFQSSLSLT